MRIYQTHFGHPKVPHSFLVLGLGVMATGFVYSIVMIKLLFSKYLLNSAYRFPKYWITNEELEEERPNGEEKTGAAHGRLAMKKKE